MEREPAKTRKSDRTRAAILAASRDLFAQLGYDATTVRGIAERAGIDAAMVIRYFGSKEALFALTVDFRMGGLEPHLPADTTPGRRGVRHFLSLWEGEKAIAALPVLLRTASSNALAAEKMRGLFETQIRALIEGLAQRPVTPECAGLIASQMLGFAFCRYILRIGPVAGMKPDRAVEVLGDSVDHFLRIDDPAPESGSQAARSGRKGAKDPRLGR